MPPARTFRSTNGQAVIIPAEIAYADERIEPMIARHGDVITMVPVRNSLKGAVAALRSMPKPESVERREPIEVPFRRSE